ncbi:MAG: ribonuclease J [Magnetococcales bacterium]|nr:ribonuclease J [Magnetococcales bacterium]
MSKSSTTPLYITPLGGLGEIGMNLMVYEYDERLLIVDCGLTFPTPDTPGIDVIIPDTRYLAENRDRIEGFVFTHGHEDHIGALPHIWPDLEGPVYGTPMTLGLLEGKFREHNLTEKVQTHEVRYGVPFELGPFKITYIPVTHSIVDAAALAITTPLGTIIHTGDFKIDHTPDGSLTTDLYALSRFGEQGVLALLSDSTNITVPGSTVSERGINNVFEKLFDKAEGLLIVATFSSNIQRIGQIIHAAAACGRKVLLNGRSMVNNITVARRLGFLNPPADTLIDIRQFRKHPREKLLVLSTGSQGEPNSSLIRIANGEHKEIKIESGDTVVFSSKFIPGNERTIWTLINLLFKSGAEVIHEKNVPEIHVSGHAPQEDLKLMMALTKPRFFIPIHGELRHLHRHTRLAWKMGIPKENTLVIENGHRVCLDGKTIEQMEPVPSGRVFVDGKGVGDVGDIVLRDRRYLSEDGLVAVVLVIEKATGAILQRPELLTRGVVYEDESQNLLEEAKEAVEAALEMGPKAMDFRDDETAGPRELALRALRRFFKKRLGRRPVVVPLVMEM